MFHDAAQFILSRRNFCIAAHVNPDGDAVGSTVAMGLGLEQLGRRVTFYNQDPVPGSLAFLPGSDLITARLPSPTECDGLILLDCSELSRAGEAIAQFAQHVPLLIIDHHIQAQVPPGLACIDSKAAATAELVYHVLRASGVQMTPEIATNLYCGLSTDTGQFRHNSTTAAVFRLAADLVAAGASPGFVSDALGNQQDPAIVRLLPLVLQTLEYHENGRVATLVLTQEMLADANATLDHAEGCIYFARSVAGVDVALFFKEDPDRSKWKVSMRSRHTVDVAAVGRQFGGGGHKQAAGCTIEGGLATARTAVLAAIRQALFV